MDVIYKDNDNVIELSAVTNGATAALIGGATIQVTLQDDSGVDVTATGTTWPVTMSAVSGATGDYQATLPYQAVLTTGTTYYAIVTCDGGSGLYAKWKMPLRAVTRTG
jgi:hypothetical protein